MIFVKYLGLGVSLMGFASVAFGTSPWFLYEVSKEISPKEYRIVCRTSSSILASAKEMLKAKGKCQWVESDKLAQYKKTDYSVSAPYLEVERCMFGVKECGISRVLKKDVLSLKLKVGTRYREAESSGLLNANNFDLNPSPVQVGSDEDPSEMRHSGVTEKTQKKISSDVGKGYGQTSSAQTGSKTGSKAAK